MTHKLPQFLFILIVLSTLIILTITGSNPVFASIIVEVAQLVEH